MDIVRILVCRPILWLRKTFRRHYQPAPSPPAPAPTPSHSDVAYVSAYNSIPESAAPGNPCQEFQVTVPTETPNTALNVFKFALGTLSSASDNIPVPGLKLAIDALLTITQHIQQSSENAKGFSELAERIKRLTPIFHFVNSDEQSTAVSLPLLTNLTGELTRLNGDIGIASSQGRVSRFFNSTDDASTLASRIATLDHIIADFTLITTTHTMHGVTQLQARQEKLLHAATTVKDSGTKKFGKITGAIGGAGGRGDQTGGAGGKGGSFMMKMASQTTYEFGDIEAGRGGMGGDSRVEGGSGGAGGDIKIVEG